MGHIILFLSFPQRIVLIYFQSHRETETEIRIKSYTSGHIKKTIIEQVRNILYLLGDENIKITIN